MSLMLLKKLELIKYLNKRDKRLKFKKPETYTSAAAVKKASQLLWKINSRCLPLLQNASYCCTLVWISNDVYENRKYYVVDIYDNITYARVLKNPAEIYSTPEYTDRIQYCKLYNNINRIVKDFLRQGRKYSGTVSL